MAPFLHTHISEVLEIFQIAIRVSILRKVLVVPMFNTYTHTF